MQALQVLIVRKVIVKTIVLVMGYAHQRDVNVILDILVKTVGTRFVVMIAVDMVIVRQEYANVSKDIAELIVD